ncbi:MAG TPA: bifunctional precorrin-2 dehydrogenase/sirohydrochlorin ferrochelatase [Thermodesulfovibrionales bacterium]|nr:bifunctional precorrin-2 dehydrogenase/sirohydrochlorin ferrochelatase [Thermodesulfovibrionales bacterium]
MTNSPNKRRKSSRPSPSKNYFPAFLDITEKKCVVIGGGRVAERKCLALIRAGARVVVISPQLTHRLESLKRKGLIRQIARHYRRGDMRSAFVAIAATDSREINLKVVADAAKHRVLLNVVDNPPLCNFIVPSVLRRGPLTIAISTGGVSPAMARTIRKNLEGLYGTELSKYLRLLNTIRTKAMQDIPDKRKRAALLKGLASQEIVRMLFRKGFRQTKRAALFSLHNVTPH